MTAVNERLRDFCERTPQASFHDLTSVFVEAIESQVCDALVICRSLAIFGTCKLLHACCWNTITLMLRISSVHVVCCLSA